MLGGGAWLSPLATYHLTLYFLMGHGWLALAVLLFRCRTVLLNIWGYTTIN